MVLHDSANPKIELITDRRYVGRVEEELDAANSRSKVTIAKRYKDSLKEVIETKTANNKIGVEADHMTLAFAKTLETQWLQNCLLEPIEHSVTNLRCVKDEAEVQRIEIASRIAEKALAETIEEKLHVGISEIEFARTLETKITDTFTVFGRTTLAFDIIVASGANAAKPHHECSGRQFRAGDLVIVDLGAKVDGYCSDMTRTFSVSKTDGRQQEIYELVAQAHTQGAQTLLCESEYKDVDAAARNIIEQGGYGAAFTHGTGHGVGLDIHENPSIGPESSDTVTCGNTVTIEPGIYINGYGGVRLEDCYLVTESGQRNLNDFPKELS